MRIALISDIHGNATALEAVLAYPAHARADRLVCLGDAVQGGPQPAAVVARLRELGCLVILGNADAWLLTGVETGAETIEAERRQRMEEVRSWSLAQLNAADLAYLRSFAPTLTLDLDGSRRLRCFHGSPRSFDDVLLPTTPDPELRAMLQPEEGTFYAGGHTHVQFIRHLGRTFHLNPGSVGLAYGHDHDPGHFRADPWAEYALLEVAGGYLSLEFRRVPVDVGALRSAYLTGGYPHPEPALAQLEDGI